MKPHLVIGLGNPLMGDEEQVVSWLNWIARDERLPAEIEVTEAGTDLLNCAGLMAGRTRVTLLDAMLDPAEPGELRVFEGDFTTLTPRSPAPTSSAFPARWSF